MCACVRAAGCGEWEKALVVSVLHHCRANGCEEVAFPDAAVRMRTLASRALTPGQEPTHSEVGITGTLAYLMHLCGVVTGCPCVCVPILPQCLEIAHQLVSLRLLKAEAVKAEVSLTST